MQPFYYEGIDVFAADGSGHVETLCNECATAAGYDLDAENENIAPIFAAALVDYYSACECCGYVFDYTTLTDEGHAAMDEATFWEIVEVSCPEWTVK